MDLKQIQQLLRENRTKKISDVFALPSAKTVVSGVSEEAVIEPQIKGEIQGIEEDYGAVLEEIKSKNLPLYESIKKLNQHQAKAIFTNNKKTLLSAMVGSGKTTVLIHKILYLHFIKDIPLDKMAVLTFTNKAANEIKERIMAFYMQSNDSCVPDLSFFGTFHSVARSILVNSPYLEDIGYTPNFTITDENEKKEFYLRIADELHLEIKYKNKIDKRIERYLEKQASSGHSGVLYSNMKYDDDLKTLIENGSVRKKQNNCMDFDDLIDKANQVLSHPESNFHPAWIIVDEFQDCNFKQIDMIMNMADDETFIFAVGDPNQLIYTWRGSDLSIFHDFKKKECEEQHLPINYRSTENILDVAKHLITYDSKELCGARGTGAPVAIINHYDSNQEAIYLANSIRILRKKDVPFREIAVLFRTKKQSAIFETVFEREEIPFEVASRRTLQDIPVLHWLTKLFKACLNKQDTSSIYDAICDQNYGIVEQTKAPIRNYKDVQPQLELGFNDGSCPANTLRVDKADGRPELEKFIEWVSLTVNNRDEFHAFASKMIEFETWLANRTYGEIPDIFEYFDLLTNLRPASINYSKDVQLVKKLLEEASEYVRLNYNTDIKSSFLAAISQLSLGGHQIFDETIDPNSEKVKLLTMHAAKGLEFRYVFISSANNGLIPLASSRRTPADLEEEKRLFFVAMTRAKDYLEISYHTQPEGWNSYPEPSMYLNDIPKDLLELKQVQESVENMTTSDHKTVDKVDQWYVGQLIKHPKYGTGTISRIAGNIVCNFEKFGEKSFALNFLPISPVEQSG